MDVDWSRGTHQAPVRLPCGRHLHLTAAGPPRSTPDSPAIIIEHGMGGSASEWVAVQHLLSHFARVYTYERAGYHPSDPPPELPSAKAIAADLRLLLATARVAPPYVLVGHSFGGVLIRQYLADFPDHVAGMVIVDSAPIVNRVPEGWDTLLGDSTYEEVVGLAANRTLSDEEWTTVQRESALNDPIAAQELSLQPKSATLLRDRLAGKQLLGRQRLSVIFCDESIDFRKVLDFGIAHGHGTEAAREALRIHLEDMSAKDAVGMREHLALSSEARFVTADGKRATHNVHMVDPEFVVREIEWVNQGAISRTSSAVERE